MHENSTQADVAYWNKLLAGEGMPARLPREKLGKRVDWVMAWEVRQLEKKILRTKEKGTRACAQSIWELELIQPLTSPLIIRLSDLRMNKF